MENATRVKLQQKQTNRKKGDFYANSWQLPVASNLDTPIRGYYLSEIKATDEKLLHEMVELKRPRSKNYEDSWGYVIQATRYGGCKWYQPDTDSLIFFGRKSPTDPTLIVTSFFAEPQYLAQIVMKVQHALKAPKTILKNVTPEQIAELKPFGFRQYNEHEGWFEESRFDDQTYPQLIIDLEKATAKKGKAYKKLRTALNKNPSLSIRNYTETDKDELLKILVSKDQVSTMAFKKTRGVYYVSHEMYLSSTVDKLVITNSRTSKILGFTATSAITPKNTTLVAAIFKPGSKIESVWGIYHTLAIQYSKGYKSLNLGGSETEGTYNFMRRTFQPVEKLEKTHLVYNP